MKIYVTKTPVEYDEISYDDNWACEATFETNNESNSDSCVAMFCKVMQLEGYADVSIASSMLGWMYEHNIDIDKLREDL